jgi:hypothetical protein
LTRPGTGTVFLRFDQKSAIFPFDLQYGEQEAGTEIVYCAAAFIALAALIAAAPEDYRTGFSKKLRRRAAHQMVRDRYAHHPRQSGSNG